MNINVLVFNMPWSLFEHPQSAFIWEDIGLNPPNPPLYPVVHPPSLLSNLSNTQNQPSTQQTFKYIIISNIPHNRSFDPFILKYLDSQDVDIVLPMVHDGISRGLSNGLILATDSEWILCSYGQLWIKRLSTSSTNNRFLLNNHQQHLWFYLKVLKNILKIAISSKKYF